MTIKVFVVIHNLLRIHLLWPPLHIGIVNVLTITLIIGIIKSTIDFIVWLVMQGVVLLFSTLNETWLYEFL